jgi:PAS domain S-box-containing protein
MPQNQRTILLVDDSPEDRETYRRYLLQDKQHAYRILEADSGEQALSLCRQQFPDAIALDYLLPDLDGLEVLNELKALRGTDDLPVVMLTGQGDEEVAVAAMKGGTSDYLVKSKLSAESLRLAIAHAIERDRLYRQRQQMEEQLQAAHDELERRVKERTASLEQAYQELQVIEEELRSSNEELLATREIAELERQHYQDLFEEAPDGYLVTDTRGNIQQANRAATALLHVSQDYLAGKPLIVFIADSDRKTFRTRLAQLQPFSDWEVYLKPQKGNPIPAAISVTIVHDVQGQRVGLRWLLRDIRDRKQAEEELRRMSAALSHAVEGISQLDVRGCYVMVNQAYASMVGYQPEEMIGMQWQHTVAPEDIEKMMAAYQQMLSSGKSEVEAKGIRKNGSIFYKRLVMVALYTEQKQLIGHYCFMKDISDRKQAEQKIREQAALLDVATDAILVRGLDDQILFWNSGAERVYGWKAEEVLGKKCSELLFKEVSPQLEQVRKTAVEKGFWQGELHKVLKSGKEIIVESRWTLVRDGVGKPKSILCVDTDITEKKQLETQLLRAQRLESIGTLASGISHDLNNILTPVLAIVQLLPLTVPDLNERTRELLEVAETNVKRAAALLKQILSFARGVPGKHTVLPVEPLFEEIKQIVAETFPKSIDFYTHIPPNLWAIEGDAAQLHQILLNLCLNARDAMPNGGRLRLSAKNLFINETYAKLNLDAQVGPYVVITVSDTGIGIPPQILDRIFDPFFTTKEVGKGMGLGLSIVTSIVKSHGGFIDVFSELGSGTQFKVFLPAAEVKEAVAENNGELPRGNGELILVVDDEAAIGETTKITLETYGYRVLTVSEGMEAIALYTEHQHEIDAVLMDLMMPTMDGAMTSRALQQIDSQVKIIAASGLVSNEQMAFDASTIVKAFLSKPYTAEDLLKTLSKVLKDN